MNKPSFGIIVGRFQLHELHDGHMELFRVVRGRHNRVIVFLGCTKTGPTRHNPLDFETRKRMIQAKFSEFTVLPLQDKRTDDEWSRELDARIDDAIGGVPAEIVLYGARESFAPYYHGKHKVRELDLDITVPRTISATEVRGKLTNTVMESADFRAGIIYAIGQLYPRVITCVDIAIIHHNLVGDGFGGCESTEVLLGRKPGEDRWRFIGGHAEPITTTFESDAAKEAMEEAHVSLHNMTYIGSSIIEDWRWKDGNDRIKTLFFAAETMDHSHRADDDVAETKWFDIDNLKPEDFVEEHRILFTLLKKHLGR